MALIPVWFTNIFTVAIGLVVGSFVNVVIVRLPKSKSLYSLVSPPSHCPKCRTRIRWWDNIPVLSYLILCGKCRKCHKRISLRYPIIELLTALLFIACRLRFGWGPLLFVRDWPLMAIFVAITFIDLEHRIIPDELSKGGTLLGLATAWWVPGLGLQASVLGVILGFGFFYALAWAYEKYKGRTGLGGGDVKLLGMVGAFMGPGGVFVTVLLSSILGSIIGILWAWISRKKNMMTVAIPYGPFLVIGALYYYLLGDLLWFRFMIPT